MREAGKSSLYRHEVRHAAIEALVEAIERIVDGDSLPSQERRSLGRAPTGRARPLMTQSVRAINWDARQHRHGAAQDPRRRRASGRARHDRRRGVSPVRRTPRTGAARPGRARSSRSATGAICRATVDGAVWITHLKRQDTATERHFKLPAARALALAGIELDVPEIAVADRRAARRRTTPTARSPTTSTPASATCTSTSTTAR